MAKVHNFQGPVNLNKFELQNARLQNLFNFPPDPFEGQIIYRSDLKFGAFYNGTKWLFFGLHNLNSDLQGGNENERFHLTEAELEKVKSLPDQFLTKHSELDLDDGTNPHGTTKEDLDLGQVDNTPDLEKPVSNPTQAELDKKANTADLAQVAFSGDYNDIINAPALQLEEFEVPLPPWVFDGNFTHSIPDGSEYGETWLFLDVTSFFWRGSSFPTRGLVVFFPALDGKSITLYPERITPNMGDKIYLTIKYAR